MKKLILSLLLVLSACQTTQSGAENDQLTTKKADLRQIAEHDKQKGDFDGAAALEGQIIGLDANDPDSFITLSRTLLKQGKKAEALDIAQTGEKLMPQEERLQLEVAMLMVENDRAGDAIAKLQTIKTLRNKDYYNTLGVANDMNNDHEQARDAFNQGLKIAPDDALLQNNLALSYIFSHDYDAAIKLLKPLARSPDAKPKYRHNLAMAYGMSGKTDLAMKILTKDMSKQEADENIKAYKQMRTEE